MKTKIFSSPCFGSSDSKENFLLILKCSIIITHHQLSLFFLFSFLLTSPFFLVPFQETPQYASRRRDGPQNLTVPHTLLRANSDTSMNLPDWMLYAQPSIPPATVAVQGQKITTGTLRSSSSPRGARSRSPSRGRHTDEAKKQRGRPR